MAEAAVTFLQEQLKEVLIGYEELVGRAGLEFELLNNDLDSLKTFLKETAKKMNKAFLNDNQFRELERRIRNAVYEVEDTIDTCLTKAIQAKKHSLRLRMGMRSFSLAKEVKFIREDKVLPLLEETRQFAYKEKIASGSGDGEEPSIKSKRDKQVRQNRVVGFEDEEQTIIGYLMQETEELDVIPIIGMPGLGKTTLAMKIYESEYIGFHFPIRIWVNISQNFDSRGVFQQIMKQFTASLEMNIPNDDELAQSVYTCLEKGKFLLVLDDVWSIDAWNEIKVVLPRGNGKGKVLITSREMEVGMYASVYRGPHQLRFLNQDESWMLLQYEAFGNLDECPPHLREIGNYVANKCDGMPLTIAMIGAILSNQRMKSLAADIVKKEWLVVSENVSNALLRDGAQNVTDIVSFSYHRLPDDLRDCFVYLGIFPEDYEIPVKMLYGLWIAEGFIQPMDGKSLEESAEENLNDLISRNLLKVQQTNRMGNVKTCRIHDMIRAFCISKSKDENLWDEIKSSKEGGVLDPSVSKIQNSHRLCLRSDLSRFLAERPSAPHVRSFLCFYERPVNLEPEFISFIPAGFPKLRILESKCINFNQFPAKVTKLIHLRYLTLYIEALSILPESITCLWNLQSLVVETKSRSITIKANLWRMIRLRHLKTKAAFVLDSKWEGEAGQKLHTLNSLAPESCTEAIYQKAKNLKTLGISGKLAKIFGSKFLENLHHLEKLKLLNTIAFEPTPEDMIHRLPQFPPNLKRLTLTNTFIEWKHMSTLAKIDTLEVLKLKDNAFVGTYWTAADDSFRCLQVLLISNVDLVIWEASSQSFPWLKCLVLKRCENLNEIPEALTETLEELEIERLPESAVESARKIIEVKKRAKVQNVPFKFSIGPGCYW